MLLLIVSITFRHIAFPVHERYLKSCGLRRRLHLLFYAIWYSYFAWKMIMWTKKKIPYLDTRVPLTIGLFWPPGNVFCCLDLNRFVDILLRIYITSLDFWEQNVIFLQGFLAFKGLSLALFIFISAAWLSLNHALVYNVPYHIHCQTLIVPLTAFRNHTSRARQRNTNCLLLHSLPESRQIDCFALKTASF